MLTHEQVEKIKGVLDDEGVDYETDDDYSGRGMGGDETTAFLIEDPLTIAWAAGKAGIDIEDFDPRIDSMGKSDKVVY